MTSIEKAHPLASKPICTPQLYDANFQVPVQLYQPLWLRRPSPQELAMQMAALCIQLDSLITSSHQPGDDHSNHDNVNRRVSFEHGYSSKGCYGQLCHGQRNSKDYSYSILAMTIYDQMKDTLLKAGIQKEVQDYMRLTGLHQLFPRVLEYLNDPGRSVADIATPEMDAHFAHVTYMNNLLSMSKQLISEVQNADSHKYISYETALLHQCVSSAGTSLSAYKREIEAQFRALKSCCVVTEEESRPRLSDDLEQWLEEMAERLSGEVTSMKPELTAPFKPLLKLIHHVPAYD